MELVFFNCRLYNGVESPVGQMGVRINTEYTTLLKSLNFLERFGDEKEITKFILDDACFDAKNCNEAFVDGISDSELPRDSILQMNEKNEAYHQMSNTSNNHSKPTQAFNS